MKTRALRYCRVCGEDPALTEEDLSKFVKDKLMKYGRDNKHKECHNKNQRRENYHAKQYGVTKEYYNECMSNAVECESCGSTKKLCYDHDHETMKFRGVLCSNCNRGLGFLGDNIEGVEKMLKYIKERTK